MRRQQIRQNLSRLILALVAVPCFLARPSAADVSIPKPQVKIENPVFDFGTVAQGVRVSHNFVIKNTGNSDLMIHRIVPACGCTAASTSGDVIAPGKDGIIKVDLDTSDFSGEKLKLVRVFTNDMEDPSVGITIKGNIEPNVVIEPARVTFNAVVRGSSEPQSRRVNVSVKPDSGLQIAEVKSFSKLVSVKMLEQSAQKASFDVILDTTAPVGEVRERLVINFKGSKEMSLNVPVFANIEGTLRLSPATISFGVIEGTDAMERSVKFENLGSAPISIKKVSSNDPALTADYSVIKEGQNYVVRVKLDPTKVSKDLRALVTVTTDSKTEPPLSLNVYGILPPKS
ncbi:MAG: DUF1573 domain-containing protein [Deltaproteobacteria bacterium]|nr:DUF1573 domain-containing protein [Deltaproteobacteria bacterium]